MFLRLIKSGKLSISSRCTVRGFSKKSKNTKDSKEDKPKSNFEFDLDKVQKDMDSALKAFDNSLQKISIGRGDPKIFDSIHVQSKKTNLASLAQITPKNANELTIKPFDSADVETILSALNLSDLRVQYRKEGNLSIHVTIPKPTQEYKNELIKQAKEYYEETKQNIRKKRQTSLNSLKDAKDVGEDDLKRIKADIQKVADKCTESIEKMMKEKEKTLNS